VIRAKTFSALVPLPKNFKVKTFGLDAVHPILPHSVLLTTAFDRFRNRGIAETLGFEKIMKVQLEDAKQRKVIPNK